MESNQKHEQGIILEARNLGFAYAQRQPVFSNVNLQVKSGEILAILGRNGAGKSTLLNCLANLLTPQEGQIFLEGRSIQRLSMREVARTVGYVSQINQPTYGYTVRDYMVMGRAMYLNTFQQPGEKDYALVDQVIEELDIKKIADRNYAQLSGGERQMAVIGRALVQQPDLLMFDEPVNHLDYGNQLKMIEMIRYLADQGYGIIITSHMPDHVLIMGDQVGILDTDGRFTSGPVETMLTEKRMSDLYGIDIHIVYEPAVGRKICISGEK